MTLYSRKRRAHLSKIRYSAPIIVLATLLQSALLIATSPGNTVSHQVVLITAAICVVASILGILFVRSVAYYPGVDRLYYIAPAFFISYALIFIVLIMMRIPYSRPLLISTFLVNLMIVFALEFALRRKLKMRIGVIPSGDYTLVPAPSVEWVVIEQPDALIDDLDAVSVDLWHNISDAWERQLANYALQDIPVYHARHLQESLTGKVEIKHLSENNFGTLTPLYTYMKVKFFADWIAALVVLLMLLPALLVIAICIRLDSPGPAIFRQTRIGYKGRPFRVYKFRTMTAAAPGTDQAMGARDAAMTKNGDQRVTRLGRFLRHSRIDELPQLANVLKGEMSWIGPRPEAEVLSRWYEKEIAFYRYRHIVRPGITGWAQVHQGHVAEVEEVQEKLHYDFYYIKNFSPWIDVIIIARTIQTILTGFGSR